MMGNPRKYGKPPYRVVLLHGGPGAPGYMAPVARELSRSAGILEPFQTRDSLEGQINELKNQLVKHADCPAILIGSSWGAVLALFLAAREKRLVEKLILVGSAVFDRENSDRIEGLRLERMSKKNRRRYNEIHRSFKEADGDERDRLMKEWGELLDESDVYDPITTDLEVIEVQYDIFRKVWSDFVSLRDKPGDLTSQFSNIDIPVIVVHGAYDPHPIEGIRPFLEKCLTDVRFHILPECGHYPWIEKKARETFYKIITDEIYKPLS